MPTQDIPRHSEPVAVPTQPASASTSSFSSRRRRRASSPEQTSANQPKRRSHMSRTSTVRSRLAQMGSYVMSTLMPTSNSSSSSSSSSTGASLPLSPEPTLASTPSGSASGLPTPSGASSVLNEPQTSSPLRRYMQSSSTSTSTSSSSLTPSGPAIPSILQRPSNRFFHPRSSSSQNAASSSNSNDQPTLPVRSPHPPTRDSVMEDQATVLARLLAIAATATASSLVENGRSRNSNLLRGSGFGRSSSSPTTFNSQGSDNSFDGFLAGLRSGLIATELSNSLYNAHQSSPRRAMNFFRMFRFTPSSERSQGDEPTMVPILIVGVRAVENDPASTEDSPRPQRRRSEGSGLFSMFDSTDHEEEEDLFNTPNSWLRPDLGPTSTQSSNTSPNIPMNTLNDRYDTESTEADQDSDTEQGNDQSRQSWIVYVFGGTYPENHPILLAPTLFSDDPSYEDLMVLESFMGQVKPPVATAEEVEEAGGLLKVVSTSGELTYLEGTTKDGELLNETVEGRCQICLSDFELEQECRKLTQCKHTFHRECIDQWLITGRNSCPLCRGEGVMKQDKTEASPEVNAEASGASA